MQEQRAATATTTRKLPDGSIVYTDETNAEQCSVEIGSDAKGSIYVRGLKVYLGLDTNIDELEKKMQLATEAMLRVVKGANA